MVEEVSHDDEGLCLLAADANWNGVALLAEQLGAVAADAAEDNLVRIGRRLRYVLVQVTAYMQMERYAAAKKLVDACGDLGSDRYTHPATGESVVPFSLLFITALLPGYCGALMESQRRLLSLLEHCQAQQPQQSRYPGDVKVQEHREVRWTGRIHRVYRALVVCYFQNGQCSEGLHVLEALIAAGRYDDDDVDYTVVRQMLHLQQLAAWCLHCGNSFLAEDVFQAIERLGTSDESPDVRQFHHFLVALNQGMRLAANDRFEEAVHVFREVARGTRDFCRATPMQVNPQETTQTTEQELKGHRCGVPTVSKQRLSAAPGARAQSALCRFAFHRLWTDAATSHVACIPYETGQGRNPSVVMANIIDTMEGYLRHNPVELLHCGAFLANCARLYTLEGDTRVKKFEQLLDLIEVFRCGRSAAPALDKM